MSTDRCPNLIKDESCRAKRTHLSSRTTEAFTHPASALIACEKRCE